VEVICENKRDKILECEHIVNTEMMMASKRRQHGGGKLEETLGNGWPGKDNTPVIFDSVLPNPVLCCR
jgi:hypothetical protein